MQQKRRDCKLLRSSVIIGEWSSAIQVDRQFYLQFRFAADEQSTHSTKDGCAECHAAQTKTGDPSGFTDGHVLLTFPATTITRLQLLNALIAALAGFEFDANYVFTGITKTDRLHPGDKLPIYISSQE
jgi:hypothetical protein